MPRKPRSGSGNVGARAVADFAGKNLDAQLRRKSGEILYSGAATMRPGRVYLLGHNPGDVVRWIKDFL